MINKKLNYRAILSTFLGLVVVAAEILFLDGYLRKHIADSPQSVQHYTKWISDLETEKPDILFIGNSITDGGLDEKELSIKLNKKVSKVAIGGSHTAWWMLYIKNVILNSSYKPKYLVIIFRRNILTLPELRVKGRYYRNLAPLMTDDESLLNNLAYKRSLSPLEFFLYENFYIFREREFIKKQIEDWVKGKISLLFSNDKSLANKTIKKVFSTSHFDMQRLRKSQDKEEKILDSEQYDFNLAVESSFLPHMIEMLKNAGVKPIFIASKMRTSAKNHKQHPNYKDYFKDLRKYLNNKNIPFYILASDKRLQENHYADGDHFNEQGREIFTNIIQEKIEDVFSKQN